MQNRLTNFIDTHPIGRIFTLGKKKAVWKKVNQLTTGMQIAIEENGKLDWDEIVSIQPVGSEQVWDIEVENTRNFVGNGILAHNTTIAGSADFVGGTSTGTLTFSGVTTDITTGTNQHLALMPNGTGNVGIGLTNPLGKLTVSNSGNTGTPGFTPTVFIGQTSNPRLLLEDQDDGIMEFAQSGNQSLIGFENTLHIKYGMNFTSGVIGSGTELMTFKSTGNVGIGTTVPGGKLHIVATGTVPGVASIVADSNSDYGYSTSSTYGAIYGENSSTAYGVAGYNSSSGFGVDGVNSSSGYGVRGVNSSTGYAIYCDATTANKCGGNQAWYNASDRRLKDDIRPITSALKKVLGLQGVTYYLKNDPNKTPAMGFIAQDVLPYAPEVVGYDEQHDQWGMQTGQLTALLAQAIKEQQTIINKLGTTGELTITSTGEVAIAGQTSNYAVTNTTTGITITKIAVLAEAAIGKLRAGLITTKDLAVTGSAQIADLSVTSLKVGGQTLQAYVEQIVAATLQNNTVTPSQTLVSPVANIETLTTKTLTVSGPTKLGSLVAENVTVSGTVVAERIEATSARVAALEAGMAELRSVRAQTAEIVDATISGTLYANNIYGFEEKLATSLREPTLLETLLGQQTAAPGSAGAIAAAELAGFQATPSAALQATLAELQLSEGDVVLSSAALFVDQYFSVNGTGYIADSLGIGNKLYVGDGLEFSDGMIAYNPTGVERPTLYIQPSGMGSISLLAGLMTLSDDGTVAINGDLNVAGTLKTDTLLSNLLQPADFGNPFQVQVAGISTESGQVKQSRFEIINELGTPVATISAQGKADFAGGIGVGSDTQVATGSSEINTDKTSGKATIAAGTSELVIHSTVLSEDSLIYVTPGGSTGNKVLYVKSQQADQFVVGFDSATTNNVSFNWWVVN